MGEPLTFSRQHKRLVVCLLLLFGLKTVLNIHGFSLASLEMSALGTRDSAGLLIGSAKDIRSDDWAIELPQAISQWFHQPRFPVVNGTIGTGQNVIAPLRAPVAHLTTVFRPLVWGFFIGDADFGVSWLWNLLSLGTFYAIFLMLMIFSGQNFWISFWGSLIFLFSPYVQFWSYHKIEIAAHAALAFVSFACMVRSRRTRIILLNGILFGWNVGGMAFEHIYPAAQVTVGYLLALLCFAVFIDVLRDPNQPRKKWTARVSALLLGIALVSIGAATFMVDTKELFAAVSQTVYPGKRISVGGGQALWIWFQHLFFTNGLVRNTTVFGNICEGAYFLFYFPLLSVITFIALLKVKKTNLGVATALILFCGVICLYAKWGVSEAFARVTLLSYVPINRLVQALGVADCALLGLVLSQRRWIEAVQPFRSALTAGWVVALAIVAYHFKNFVPSVSTTHFVLIAAASGFFVYFLFLAPGRQTLALAVLAMLSIFYTGWFNPTARGGVGVMRDDPLAQAILKTNHQQPGAWIAFSTDETTGKQAWTLGSFFRILGVQSFDGFQIAPPLELWRTMDSSPEAGAIYNRSGYVHFNLADQAEAKFSVPTEGHVHVAVRPDNAQLQRAGLKYFLVVGDEPSFLVSLPTAERIERIRNVSLFRLRPQTP